jgi:hypothetical protein
LSLPPGPDITVAACASLLGLPPGEADRLVVELTSTGLITEHQPGRYSWHDLIRAYAMELSERSDTDADRHEAQARLLHHYLHSSYAAHGRSPATSRGETPGPFLPAVGVGGGWLTCS